MKLSLMWLSEYLDIPTGGYFILDHAEEIVRRLVRSTAEIEQSESIALDVQKLFLGRSTELLAGTIVLEVPELCITITMPARHDGRVGAWYMLCREGADSYRYATLLDATYRTPDVSARNEQPSAKDSLLPVFYIPDAQGDGSWKERCEVRDVRITVDNKSINHRPDLWSHYGFAREVAVLMGWKLKPLSTSPSLTIVPAAPTFVEVRSTTCDRFARLDLDVAAKASVPWMALRLMRLDQKPLAAIVDATNYVMFDVGQPLHAFDRACIEGALLVRDAQPNESLTLLDNVTIPLRNVDCVVSDQRKALSLAGIKGGLGSGISLQTQSIILEAAHFLPIPIRRTAKSHHLRTESSTRFEKGIDSALVVAGVNKFFNLLVQEHIIPAQNAPIMLWEGSVKQPAPCIQLSHARLVDKIGVALPQEDVVGLLSLLGFTVCSERVADAWCYAVEVPSWRLNDIQIPEDLIEEVVRVRGYDGLPAILPQRPAQLPVHKGRVLRTRAIRHHLAYGLRMQEVMSYPFFDEEFLRTLQIVVKDAPTVRNPVSEQWRRLVTSLIPNLLSQMASNLPEEKEVRLFEVGTSWIHEGDVVRESRKVAWVWYLNGELDFYQGKQTVVSLLEMLKLTCSWHSASVDHMPSWWRSTHSAVLKHEHKVIGVTGLINPSLMAQIGGGSCFAVELDLDALQHYMPARSCYQPLSKYPTIATDISMFASYVIPVETIIKLVSSLHLAINHVSLIDFFEKKAWEHKRSVTIRVICGDSSRTMTHDEVNEIITHVVATLKERFEVEVR